jgi:hypothetical protein
MSPSSSTSLRIPRILPSFHALIDFLALLGALSEFRFMFLHSLEMDIAWDMAFLFFL